MSKEIQHKTRVRVAMIPLDYKNRDKADNNELMIDRENNLIYIKKDNQIIQYPDKNRVHDDVEHLLNNHGIVGEGDITLGSLVDDSDDLHKWVIDTKTSNKDGIGTDEIFNMVKSINPTDTFMELMYDKVDKVIGKDLVTNNFTNYYKNKLESIDEGAGVYEHPEEQQCDYIPPVTSVNGKTGAMAIYKDDIAGLENIEPNANNYIHPPDQQCMHTFVIQSVNGIDDSEISINKKDLDLNRISNMRLMSYEDVHNGSGEGYVTPRSVTKYIDYLLKEVQ